MRWIFVFSLTLLIAGLAVAADPMPTWSPEQQEVIKVQKECWSGWYRSFDTWVKACRPIKELVWWFPKNPVQDLNDQLKDGRKWREGLEAYRYYHLRPQAIQIFGDTAVMYYEVVHWDRQWGTEMHVEERRAEVFRKIDGKWCLAGGLVTEID
jgi:uncharacterized protein DUF4440